MTFKPPSGTDDSDPGLTDPGYIESSDAREVPALDLAPRAPRPHQQRRWIPLVVVVVILAGLGFVATKALGDAALFFYNADEAVAKQAELGDSRFRLQGQVQADTIRDTPAGVEFEVAYNDVHVEVFHQGDPVELFEEGRPVVLEGHWDPSGEVFASDRMLVKHDETYTADNDDRITDAERGGDA